MQVGIGFHLLHLALVHRFGLPAHRNGRAAPRIDRKLSFHELDRLAARNLSAEDLGQACLKRDGHDALVHFQAQLLAGLENEHLLLGRGDAREGVGIRELCLFSQSRHQLRCHGSRIVCLLGHPVGCIRYCCRRRRCGRRIPSSPRRHLNLDMHIYTGALDCGVLELDSFGLTVAALLPSSLHSRLLSSLWLVFSKLRITAFRSGPAPCSIALFLVSIALFLDWGQLRGICIFIELGGLCCLELSLNAALFLNQHIVVLGVQHKVGQLLAFDGGDLEVHALFPVFPSHDAGLEGFDGLDHARVLLFILEFRGVELEPEVP